MNVSISSGDKKTIYKEAITGYSQEGVRQNKNKNLKILKLELTRKGLKAKLPGLIEAKWFHHHFETDTLVIGAAD